MRNFASKLDKSALIGIKTDIKRLKQNNMINMTKETIISRMAWDILTKTLTFLAAIIMATNVSATTTVVDATLEHTGSTYYRNDNVLHNSIDAEKEYYNNPGGQNGWNGQALMKFTFNVPENKTIVKATLIWSTIIYGSNTSERDNELWCLTTGNDINWSALSAGTCGMVSALHESKRVMLSNTKLSGNTEHLNNVSSVMVTIALQQAERQGYIVFYLTNNQAGASLYGKASSHAPTLRLELADKRTVTFNAGDNATCATTSLTSIAEEDTYTAVTLPEATDNKGATFMGWYTAPLGGTRVGGTGDPYTPTSDITLYAQYDRAPTGIAITGESTIKYGATTTLTATLSPSNTVNSGITWYTGNSDIATVDQNGVVTARGLGSVYITVRADDNPTNIYDMFQLKVESDNYSYAVNAVDGNGNVLKEIKTGTYATGTGQLSIPIPQYVLSGTTLYETTRGPSMSGNYYTYFVTPNTDGYVGNINYTNSTVNNVVFYTEAEQCSALSQKYINSTVYTRASNDTIARNSAYGTVTTLAPGTYTIYASAINCNSNTFTYKFKAGDVEVMSADVAKGNNVNASSAPFTITETTTLAVYCPAGGQGGLDYFYIVQDPVYHVTTHGQKLPLNKPTIDATTYTTCNPISSDGNNAGTRNGVDGPFYNIKNKGNYVTVTADGAIAFSVDAFHGNSKDTRKMHVYVDDVEILAISVDPAEYVTSPIIATGGTGTHTIKITGDGKDVYLADIVFYTEKTVPKMNPSDVTVKVGETKQLHLTLPEGCILNGMTSSGDASKVTASFVRDDETQRKGELTLTGLQVTGNTPTSVTFSITAGANTIYNSGTATIEIDVLKAGLTLAYSDGDAGDEATMYVCNADETTPSLPTITLTAKDDSGNPVSLDNLNITYTSDDHTVATVSNTGVITLVHPYGNGTARIKARSTGNASYDDAEAEYSITIQRGVNWKIAEHPTFKDAPPAVRDTFHVYKNVGGTEKLYLIGTFGGWNRNNNTYNYPNTTTPKTDHWYGNDKNKKMTTSSSGVDGFSKYRSGGQDASNESMYSSLKQYYNDVIYGVERFGWFKQPDNGESHPFTLPVRGAYVTLEPAVNGTLSVYIEQNGPWNNDKNDIYDNDGNWISQVNGKAVKFPGHAPYQYRPHAFFIVDQNGKLVEDYTPVNIVTRTAVTGGISTGSSSADPAAALEAFCDKYGCEKGEKFKCILDETADGYNDATNVGNWKEFKEYMSAEEQQRVHDNWSAGVNGAQVITKLDNGAYLALHGGMVKYTFHVVSGQTYYIFSNFSKIGFSGVNFVPDEEAQPSDTLALSETVAYDPSTLKAAEGNNTVPMYETITLDRSFTDGKWNTICLPFGMTEKEVRDVFGENTELIILDRVSVDEGHANIYMVYHEIQNILAGYPYLIKPTQDVDHIEVHNKLIDPTQQVYEFTNGDYTSTGVSGFCYPQTFVVDGVTYDKDVKKNSTLLKEGDIFLSGNTLYVSRGKSFLKGYRSYLRKDNEEAAPAKSASLFFDNPWDDEETGNEPTLIDVAQMADELREQIEVTVPAGVYNLGGQRVSDTVKNLPRGMYISKGKKIIIK